MRHRMGREPWLHPTPNVPARLASVCRLGPRLRRSAEPREWPCLQQRPHRRAYVADRSRTHMQPRTCTQEEIAAAFLKARGIQLRPVEEDKLNEVSDACCCSAMRWRLQDFSRASHPTAYRLDQIATLLQSRGDPKP